MSVVYHCHRHNHIHHHHIIIIIITTTTIELKYSILRIFFLVRLLILS